MRYITEKELEMIKEKLPKTMAGLSVISSIVNYKLRWIDTSIIDSDDPQKLQETFIEHLTNVTFRQSHSTTGMVFDRLIKEKKLKAELTQNDLTYSVKIPDCMVYFNILSLNSPRKSVDLYIYLRLENATTENNFANLDASILNSLKKFISDTCCNRNYDI